MRCRLALMRRRRREKKMQLAVSRLRIYGNGIVIRITVFCAKMDQHSAEARVKEGLIKGKEKDPSITVGECQ